MKKNNHLTLEDRIIIEQKLNQKASFKSIAYELGKDPTTISKEVRNHIQFRKKGCYGKTFNDCVYRKNCLSRYLCGSRKCTRYCPFCKSHPCSSLCTSYKQEICSKLSKPPYTCNGCLQRNSCTLEKRIYSASQAQNEYKLTLSESRQGLQITNDELKRLDSIISPLILKGQSLHNICTNHRDDIMLGERSIYSYVNSGLFKARNIDMPRVVRMGKRKAIKNKFKVDKLCRHGRTYQDYVSYMREHPDSPVVQMDTVEGHKGGKVLLTLHFPIPQLMLAFIRDYNTSQSVIDIFNQLYLRIHPDIFCSLFPVLLGDNGSEFSNPSAIERDPQGRQRSHVFYCDPQSPYQKGAVENNHLLIRRILPKGSSFDNLTQEDVSLMMSHINSYSRSNLGDKTPYEVFASLYGEKTLERMGISFIEADDVILRPSLFKK